MIGFLWYVNSIGQSGAELGAEWTLPQVVHPTAIGAYSDRGI